MLCFTVLTRVACKKKNPTNKNPLPSTCNHSEETLHSRSITMPLTGSSLSRETQREPSGLLQAWKQRLAYSFDLCPWKKAHIPTKESNYLIEVLDVKHNYDPPFTKSQASKWMRQALVNGSFLMGSAFFPLASAPEKLVKLICWQRV